MNKICYPIQYSTSKEATVAEYRELTATSYDDAVKQLQPGETLVAANVAAGKPERGNIPVTSDRSFRVQTEMGRNTIHARKG